MIAALIQFGGLGFMTFAILVLTSLQGKMGLSGSITAQEALGTHSNQIGSTAKAVSKLPLSPRAWVLGLTLFLAPLKG